MLNPPETSTGTNGSTCGQNDVTRYRINPNTKSLTAETFPNVMSSDDKLKRYLDNNKFIAESKTETRILCKEY